MGIYGAKTTSNAILASFQHQNARNRLSKCDHWGSPKRGRKPRKRFATRTKCLPAVGELSNVEYYFRGMGQLAGTQTPQGLGCIGKAAAGRSIAAAHLFTVAEPYREMLALCKATRDSCASVE